MYVAKPEVTKVSCIRRCASRKRAQGGSTLRVSGTSLDGVVRLIFSGSRGRSDDTVASVRSGGSTRMTVKVPIGAVSGPLVAFVSRSVRSLPTKPTAILPAPPPEPNTELSPVTERAADRDRHEPHEGVRGRAAGGHVLLPDVGRRSG